MSTDPGEETADVAALRRRLYQPDATDADRAAFAALATTPPTRRPAAAPEGRDGAVVEVLDVPVAEDRAPARRRTRMSLRTALIGGGAVLLIAVGAAALLHPQPTSLGPAPAARLRLVALSTTARVPPIPEGADAGAVAAYFGRLPSAPAERSIAARKPFFGSGVGPTDFALQGFDIGASTASVTIVTDRAVDATAAVAASTGAALHQVLLASGRVRALEPAAASSAYDGLDDPRILRVVVPQGVPFVVRSVFLTPIDLGIIDR